MAERSNAEKIRLIEKWQNAGVVHELTCRVDSRHVALAPIVLDGKVVLLCPTCKTVQDDIPEQVLEAEAFIDFNLGLFAASHQDAELARARSDVWFAVAVIILCASILPGLIGGLTVGIACGLIGAVLAAVYAGRKFRQLDAESGAKLPESPP
jgi:hypothetical protein